MLVPCQKGKLIVKYVFCDVGFNRQYLQKLFSSLDYFNCKRPEGLSISASVLYSIKNRNLGDTRTMKQKEFQIDAKFKSIHGAMICQREIAIFVLLAWRSQELTSIYISLMSNSVNFLSRKEKYSLSCQQRQHAENPPQRIFLIIQICLGDRYTLLTCQQAVRSTEYHTGHPRLF